VARGKEVTVLPPLKQMRVSTKWGPLLLRGEGTVVSGHQVAVEAYLDE